MRMQCNGCEVAEAKVLCCADEAALCWDCDEKVHAANKLASKHQRVLLSHSSSQMPKCDICQGSYGMEGLACRGLSCSVALLVVDYMLCLPARDRAKLKWLLQA
nr:BBX transcription factor [Toona sinensis]